jgi:hypothetical protein
LCPLTSPLKNAPQGSTIAVSAQQTQLTNDFLQGLCVHSQANPN